MKGVLVVVLCPASTTCTTPPPCNQPHPEGASSGRRVSEFVSAHRAPGRYCTCKLSWEVCAGMSKLLANRMPWADEPGLSWFLYSADHLGARWARSDSQPPHGTGSIKGLTCVSGCRVPGRDGIPSPAIVVSPPPAATDSSPRAIWGHTPRHPPLPGDKLTLGPCKLSY